MDETSSATDERFSFTQQVAQDKLSKGLPGNLAFP
jgi:hypothetical protein